MELSRHAIDAPSGTLNVSGNFTDNGGTFSANSGTVKMDGTEASMKGDPGITTESVKKFGKNALEETDKRNGKVVSMEAMTMSGDDKTITVKYDNKERGTSMSWREMKQ